jgi:hypothetical protein
LVLVALANFMRLSLLKAAHAVLSNAAWQEIRVRSGRDDNFVVGSATLGMTKGSVIDPFGFDHQGKMTKLLPSAKSKGETEGCPRSRFWDLGSLKPIPPGNTLPAPLSSREVMTFFDFPQKGLLIDVATAPTTALALGNGHLLSATLSFVIPTGAKRAEGSAVQRNLPGNVFWSLVRNLQIVERETGIEPATNGLGSRYSTIELLPPAATRLF